MKERISFNTTKVNGTKHLMKLSTSKIVASEDYSNTNLQKLSFKNASLRYVNFSDCDLRGTDFSGADLTEAAFVNVQTGIPSITTAWIFAGVFVLSLLSGYIATLAGNTIQGMLVSETDNIKAAGIISTVIIVSFVGFSFSKNVCNSFSGLIVLTCLFSLAIGVVIHTLARGDSMDMIFLILTLVFIAVMFVVGTVARTAETALSNALFAIVALSGSFFGRSIGGIAGTTIMAIACMLISKKALEHAKGFEALRKVGYYFTRKFGTSFRGARLIAASFSDSDLQSTDFTHADITLLRLHNTKKNNCIIQRLY